MAAKIGKTAPDFTAQAVVNGEVQELTLSSYYNKGKYTVVFFYPLVRRDTVCVNTAEA